MTVQVTGNPNSYDAGETVTLQCNVVGANPAPTIQWAKDMVDIPGATSSALSFPAAVVDAGSYSCTATNVVAPVMSSPVVIVVFGRIINITKVINSIFYFIYVFH